MAQYRDLLFYTMRGVDKWLPKSDHLDKHYDLLKGDIASHDSV